MDAGSPQADDAGRWVEDHADAMYRFALLRLGDPDRAEEAVQEALVAAIARVGAFEGRSQLRTWLIGILRNKVVDQIRSEARDRRALTRVLEESEGVFEGGVWAERQRAWDWPAPATPEREELNAMLEAGVRELPEPMRQAFYLRVLDGMDAPTVCEILGISATNLWTLVHRAKVRLRKGLNERWFGADGPREE